MWSAVEMRVGLEVICSVDEFGICPRPRFTWKLCNSSSDSNAKYFRRRLLLRRRRRGRERRRDPSATSSNPRFRSDRRESSEKRRLRSPDPPKLREIVRIEMKIHILRGESKTLPRDSSLTGYKNGGRGRVKEEELLVITTRRRKGGEGWSW